MVKLLFFTGNRSRTAEKNKVDYCDNFFSVAGDFGLVKF